MNEDSQILISSENRQDFSFTKFPGGGLELGEGVLDCLKREFGEELGVEIDPYEHFYTTDFFQRSAFRKEEQLISIYYKVKLIGDFQILDGQMAKDFIENHENRFYWINIKDLKEEIMTFPVDKEVVKLLSLR